MNDDDNSLASGEHPLEWVDDILQDEWDVDGWFYDGHSIEQNDGHQQPGRGNLVWNFVPASNINTAFSVNEARAQSWTRAKNEIKSLKSRITTLTGKNDFSNVTKDDVVDIFFGRGDQSLLKVLGNELKIKDYETMAEFMNVLCLQGIFRHKSCNLYKILDSYFPDHASELLGMDHREYLDIWKKMSDVSRTPDGTPSSRRGECLWEKLQLALNRILREMTVVEREDTIHITHDDDKIHMGSSGQNGRDGFNLKQCTHTKANRKGPTLHTSASSALFFPMNVQFETTGDSALTCFKRSIRFLMNARPDANNVSDSNFTSWADRGYLCKSYLETIAKDGGDGGGTTKRSLEFPFTTGQTLRDGDNRICLEPDGAPSLFVSKTIIEGKQFTANAFKSGTGNISTTISSIIHGHKWDGIPVKNSKEKPSPHEYFSRMSGGNNETEWPEAKSENEATIMEGIASSKVHVCTIAQGTAEWHLLRKFSLTSSQADAAFRDTFSFHWRYSDKQSKLRLIANCIYGENWQSVSTLLSLHEHDGTEMLDPTIELDRFKAAFCTQTNDGRLVQYQNVNNIDIYNASPQDVISVYVSNDGTLSESDSCRLVERMTVAGRRRFIDVLLNHVPENDRVAANKNHLKKWFAVDNCHRKWMFYKREKLLPTLSARGVKISEVTTNPKTWEKMAETDDISADAVNEENDRLKTFKQSTHSVMKRSFQAPLAGKQRSACRIGHKNEPIIIRNFVRDINSGDFSLFDVSSICAIYQAGLVAKRGEPYVKDSIDFIAIVRLNNGNFEAIAGEVKTRTDHQTKNAEITYQRNRFQTHHNVPRYSRCSFRHIYDSVHKTSERMQLLHHAYTYSFNFGLLLIGDSNGNIIHGTLVSFDATIMNAYKTILFLAKETSLKWVYDNVDASFTDSAETNSTEDASVQRNVDTTSSAASAENNSTEGVSADRDNAENLPSGIDNDCIQIPPIVLDIADSDDLKKLLGGRREFQSIFFLWLSVLKEIPLPPLKRIIPYQHSTWNGQKPASDIITQFLEMFAIIHPFINANTRATTRLIMVAIAAIHRTFQFMSDNNIDGYDTLVAYRNAASKRNPFLSTLMYCQGYFKARVSVNSPDSQFVDPAPPVTPQVRRRREGLRVPYNEDHGMRIDISDIVSPSTGKSPRRQRKKSRIEPEGTSSYATRRQTCRGIPLQLKIPNQKDRPRCALCNSKTQWVCGCCRLPLCLGTNIKPANAKDRDWNVYSFRLGEDQNGDGIERVYIETCFHIAHKHNYETYR